MANYEGIKEFIWKRANTWANTLMHQQASRGIKFHETKKPYIIVEEDEKNKGKYYLIINYQTCENETPTPRRLTCEFNPFQDIIGILYDENLLEAIANQQP